ncbi:ATP-dependent DNA helicase II subunit 1 [Cytospora mali]|uniref:ATP-dependent DNA helicase II subunit 1 n=1 Tax=Cytospora mali TaxID=578113 RepID=A0A194VY21_CYTMA|nr:ATP-dependent DNA helicase II subunit 1 [Valsa mali]
MSWNRDENQRRDDEEDDQDELGENDYKAQKDAVLFAIDVSESMLAPVDDGSKDRNSAVMAALKSASQLMQQRIIAQPKDMMGILFFGTEKTKFRDEVGGKSTYPHCYLHTDLDIPSAEIVKALKDMAESGEDPDGILKPTDDGFSMANMLFCANQIFTTNAPNFGSRRLFIVTDNDDPEKGDKDKRQGAAVRAKDLFDLGVTIELFPISREGRKFDLDNFYTDIIYRDPLAAADPENPGEIKAVQSGDGLTLLNSLISSINAKQSPKRAYFSKMPFHIAPGLTISINGYLLLHKQAVARSCYIWLEGERPQIAKGELVKTEQGSMRTVEKSEIRKAYKFGSGGDFVDFTPDELNKIKKFDTEEKTLRILGFKPRSMLPPWAAVKKSAFIFPTEAGFVGSTRVFSALWRKLLDSDKMAIAWYIARKNAGPQIVAILPSNKPSDEESGTSYLPAGLWLYPLPFVDDMRDLEPIKHKPVVKASDDLIDHMRTIVQNLTMPKGVYDPSKYPNPALQWHYKVLQNMALDEDLEKEKKEDFTQPKYRQINKRVGGYQVELQGRIKVEAAAVQQELAIKRDAEEEDAEDRPKKRMKAAPKKAAAPSGGITLAELKEAIDDDSLRKKTVVDLKAICTEKGLHTTGKKKADLLETIEEWVESQT